MERKQIKVSQILDDLENGLGRNEIKEKYSLSGSEMKLIFSHPKLKGRKAKKVTIDFIDDTKLEEELEKEELKEIDDKAEVSDQIHTNTEILEPVLEESNNNNEDDELPF